MSCLYSSCQVVGLYFLPLNSGGFGWVFVVQPWLKECGGSDAISLGLDRKNAMLFYLVTVAQSLLEPSYPAMRKPSRLWKSPGGEELKLLDLCLAEFSGNNTNTSGMWMNNCGSGCQTTSQGAVADTTWNRNKAFRQVLSQMHICKVNKWWLLKATRYRGGLLWNSR